MNKTCGFPRLHVLDALIEQVASKAAFESGNTAIVCVQHLLETTGSMIDALLRLGMPPANIFVLGKAYSSNLDIVNKIRKSGIWVEPGNAPDTPGGFRAAITRDVGTLWNLVGENLSGKVHNLIILDDGGRALEAVPDAIFSQMTVVGIEQTQSGLDRLPVGKLPIVLVAESVAKKGIEAPLVGRKIRLEISKYLTKSSGLKSIGVVGLGHVGSSVARQLFCTGFDVIVYDRLNIECYSDDGIRLKRARGLRDLVKSVDALVGCTGRDLFGTSSVDDEWFNRCKYLVSCSSEDTEFGSILRRFWLPSGQPKFCVGQDLVCGIGGREFTVVRGGYPINFDGGIESVPRREIELTRGLLFGAILQAEELCRSGAVGRKVSLMLSPVIQEFVCREWYRCYPDIIDTLGIKNKDQYLEMRWLRKESGGRYNPTKVIG